METSVWACLLDDWITDGSQVCCSDDVSSLLVLRDMADGCHADTYLYLNGRVFHYRLSRPEDRRMGVLVVLGELNQDPVGFHISMETISGCEVRFLAASSDQILAQVGSSHLNARACYTTVLFDLVTRELRVVEGVGEIQDAYTTPSGAGGFWYRDHHTPSIIQRLEVTNLDVKLHQLTSFKEWPAAICFDPRLGHDVITYIVSTEEPWKHGAQGHIACYSVKQKKIVRTSEQEVVSSEVLRYSATGRLLLAYKKFPTAFLLITADDLDIVQIVQLDKYCPFLDLPFKFPDKVNTLLENEILPYFPVAKVLLQSDALTGLMLKEESCYILLPLIPKDEKDLVLVHINVGCPESSEAEIHEFQWKPGTLPELEKTMDTMALDKLPELVDTMSDQTYDDECRSIEDYNCDDPIASIETKAPSINYVDEEDIILKNEQADKHDDQPVMERPSYQTEKEKDKEKDKDKETLERKTSKVKSEKQTLEKKESAKQQKTSRWSLRSRRSSKKSKDKLPSFNSYITSETDNIASHGDTMSVSMNREIQGVSKKSNQVESKEESSEKMNNNESMEDANARVSLDLLLTDQTEAEKTAGLLVKTERQDNKENVKSGDRLEVRSIYGSALDVFNEHYRNEEAMRLKTNHLLADGRVNQGKVDTRGNQGKDNTRVDQGKVGGRVEQGKADTRVDQGTVDTRGKQGTSNTTGNRGITDNRGVNGKIEQSRAEPYMEQGSIYGSALDVFQKCSQNGEGTVGGDGESISSKVRSMTDMSGLRSLTHIPGQRSLADVSGQIQPEKQGGVKAQKLTSVSVKVSV